MVVIAMLCLLSAISALAFEPGEKLTFNVKYGVVSAGSAVLEVRSSVLKGKEVWNLTTTAQTYPFFDSVFKVRDRVESWWDKETLLSLKYEKTLNEGTYHQHRIQTFDQQNKTSVYQKWNFKKETWKCQKLSLPFTTQDVLSAFYSVRNLDLKTGGKYYVNISADGKSNRTEIDVLRSEKLNTIFGVVNCLIIQPKLKGEGVFKQKGRILIWLTDDEYKIPMKLESSVSIGSFIAKLTDAQNVPYIIKYPEK
jgi:hypothetical protein